MKRRRLAVLGLSTVTTAATIAMITGFVQAPAAGPGAAAVFPHTWTNYAGNQERNAAFSVPASAPTPLKQGVSWKFAEMGALPLGSGPYDENVLGYLPASVKTTQMLGNAVGVTALDGRIYAESDMNTVYALDAMTGHKIWQASTNNAAMGNPVAGDGLVFVGSGDTGFSFASVMRYAAGAPGVTRGMGWAGVYAFNAKTGKKVWQYDTKGEDMPSLSYLNGNVYIGNGDGHMYALDAKTGKPAWITDVGGFDSMSSANYWHDPATGRDLVFAGFSAPSYLYAFDAATGQVVWKSTIPNVFNTGMGDNSPTVDSRTGIVLQDSVVEYDKATGTSDLALFATDAHTGQVLWETKLGRGPSPLAYKAAISMVHDGVVYLGNPATGHEYAVDEKTGKIQWETNLGTYTWRGTSYQIQNRGGPTYYDGVLYQAAGAYIFAIDPSNGHILSRYTEGGRYGIVNPVIVGGTMYLGDSYNWVHAIPLSRIYQNWVSGPAA